MRFIVYHHGLTFGSFFLCGINEIYDFFISLFFHFPLMLWPIFFKFQILFFPNIFHFKFLDGTNELYFKLFHFSSSGMADSFQI
jgi:hypothetical protein